MKLIQKQMNIFHGCVIFDLLKLLLPKKIMVFIHCYILVLFSHCLLFSLIFIHVYFYNLYMCLQKQMLQLQFCSKHGIYVHVLHVLLNDTL